MKIIRRQGWYSYNLINSNTAKFNIGHKSMGLLRKDHNKIIVNRYYLVT